MLSYYNGLPIYWRYLNWESLEKAVEDYFEPYACTPTEPVLELREEYLTALKRYLSYWIEAPAWRYNLNDNPAMIEFLESLVEAVPSLESRSEISVFLAKCIMIGLDPF